MAGAVRSIALNYTRMYLLETKATIRRMTVSFGNKAVKEQKLSCKQVKQQGKKPPTNHRTTDVETSTFISLENRRVEEPIHFTTY